MGEPTLIPCGAIVRGNEFNEEKKLIQSIQILICTPGRILQHLEETYEFNYDQL